MSVCSNSSEEAMDPNVTDLQSISVYGHASAYL